MSKRSLVTAVGYTIFIVLPFIYMAMTIYNLMSTEGLFAEIEQHATSIARSS